MRGSKTCFKCSKTLPRSQFYKHSAMADGLLGKCKECTKTDSSLHRRMHIDEHREYDSLRAKQPSRKALGVANTKKLRKEKTGYQSAHNAVARALRNGILSKQPCQMCGTRNFIHAHHDDYSKPLDVMWLCPEHHASRHAFLSYKEQF